LNLYEGMFLIDNDLVREDWSSAKAVVTDTLEKYGATVQTARRWDERALAYPINGHRRATYLLTYFELGSDSGPDLRRDLEMNDHVLRYMILRTDELPEDEREAASAEGADDYEAPAPKADDHAAYRPIQTEEEASEEGEGEEGEAKEGEAVVTKATEAPGAETPSAETPSAETPAVDAPAAEAAAAETPAAGGEEESK